MTILASIKLQNDKGLTVKCSFVYYADIKLMQYLFLQKHADPLGKMPVLRT